MAIPAGLHIGGEDGILYTWNGTVVANTLNFEANFGVPANKDVTCLLAFHHLFVGVEDVAEFWYHDGAAWAQVFDATATNIVEIQGNAFLDKYVFALAVDDLTGGTGAAGTQIWRWDCITPAAVPTTPIYTIPAKFIGTSLISFKEEKLVCTGVNDPTSALLPEIYYSVDKGASWINANFPSPYSLSNGVVLAGVEHTDGYLYVVFYKGAPPTDIEIWRTPNLATWELCYSLASYMGYSRSGVSYKDELFFPVWDAGPSATSYIHYDGTTWEVLEAHATGREPRVLSYFTDSSVAAPLLWMVADDDLLSYDPSTEAWTVEDTGATGDKYKALAGGLDPAGTPSWEFPTLGSGITTDSGFKVEGTGLSTDVRIYKDVVLDTTNWTITYHMNEMTGKSGATFSRDAALTETLTKIDVYISDHSGNWNVARTAHYSKPAATTVTTGIKGGSAVRHLSDGKQYYVAKARMSGTDRYLYLMGAGIYNDTWVISTVVERIVSGPLFAGFDLNLGTPAAAPP